MEKNTSKISDKFKESLSKIGQTKKDSDEPNELPEPIKNNTLNDELSQSRSDMADGDGKSKVSAKMEERKKQMNGLKKELNKLRPNNFSMMKDSERKKLRKKMSSLIMKFNKNKK